MSLRITSVLLAAGFGCTAFILILLRTPAPDEVGHQDVQVLAGSGASAAQTGPIHEIAGRTNHENDRESQTQLLQAQVTVNDQLAKSPDNPSWIEAGVALDLFNGDYETALKVLDRALDSWPNRSSLLHYQAVALSEKARALGREDLLAPAYVNLTRLVDTSSELRQVALFNRAIVAEDLLLFQRASQDWQRYLQSDRSGPWRKEAERRREATGRRFLQGNLHSVKESDEKGRSEVQEHYPVERMIESAVTEWIPGTLQASAPGVHELEEKLDHLAEQLEKHHGDRWLRDLLKGPRSPAWTRATLSLARAARLNLSGERGAGARESQHAIRGFEQAGNAAGSLAARVERMYALNRSFTVTDCLDAARGLEGSLTRRRYAFHLTQFLIELAGCQSRGDRLSDAERNLERAFALAGKANYSALQLRAQTVLANHHAFSGNFTAAWNESWIALNRFWTGEFGAVRGHTLYFNFSMTAERLGYPELALALEQEASSFNDQTPNRLQVAEGLFREGMLASRLGDRAASEHSLSAGQIIIAQLPDDAVKRRYQWLFQKGIAEADLDRGAPHSAIGILDEFGPLVMREDLPYERLDYFRLSARAHGALGDHAHEYQSLRLAADASERAFSTLTTEEDRIRWRVQAGAVFRPLVESTLLQPDGAKKAFEVWEGYLDRSGNNDNTVSSWAHLNRVALEKLNHATLVSFIWLRDRVGMWTADEHGVSFSWAPGSASQIAVLARRFARQCSDSDVPEMDVRRTGLELDRRLFGNDGASGIAARPGTLIIEPDGELGAVPFEALVETNGRYLSESHAVIYSSGMKRFLRSRTGAPTADAAVLVVAAPAVSGKLARQFPPMPDARREGYRVASAFRRATVLSDGAATLDATKASLKEAELFHFAGHGLAYSDDGALLLATERSSEEGSLLTTGELSGLKLTKCKLAVLAACSSGAGEKRGPVNPNSLVSGFLRAGVQSVVASRWAVDSAATSALMEQFYRRVLSTHEVSQALQEAARQLRKAPGTTHPYYWAAFSAFGR